MASRSRLNCYFCAICLSVAMWLVCTGLGYLVKENVHLAAFWFALDWVGVSFISVNVYAFSSVLLGLKRERRIVLGYSLAVIFSILTVTVNPLLAGVKHYPWGFFPLWNVKWSVVFLAFFFSYMGQAFTDYILCYVKTNNAIEKNKIKYMFLAFLIAYIGSVDYLPTFGLNVYPFGFLTITCFVAISGYTISRHRLMDITIIIRKTLIYSVVTGSLTILYLGVIALFARIFQGLAGYQTIFSSAVAAGMITVCFQPLRKKVQAFVDSKFFRQYVDREEKLYELSREVITHTTPEAMAQSLIRVLGDTLHPKSSALYLRSRDGNGFVLASQQGGIDLPITMAESNVLTNYFVDHPQPFVQQDLPIEGESLDTRRPPRSEEAA